MAAAAGAVSGGTNGLSWGGVPLNSAFEGLLQRYVEEFLKRNRDIRVALRSVAEGRDFWSHTIPLLDTSYERVVDVVQEALRRPKVEEQMQEINKGDIVNLELEGLHTCYGPMKRIMPLVFTGEDLSVCFANRSWVFPYLPGLWSGSRGFLQSPHSRASLVVKYCIPDESYVSRTFELTEAEKRNGNFFVERAVRAFRECLLPPPQESSQTPHLGKNDLQKGILTCFDEVGVVVDSWTCCTSGFFGEGYETPCAETAG